MPNHQQHHLSTPRLNTPVAFLVYNRLEPTKKVFERIRNASPAKLMVIADGPNSSSKDDYAACQGVRDFVLQNIDWKCDVETNFSETNLGCAKRVTTGLDWVFDRVPEAIILEDDCLPDPSFFQYCEELLDRFRDVKSIAQISGFSPVNSISLDEKISYSFSRYSFVWGWASWARAWKENDSLLTTWSFKESSFKLNTLGLSKRESFWRNTNYARTKIKQFDSWDYPWDYAKISKGFISIIPKYNLVDNIGIGPDSTHTKSAPDFPIAKKIELPLNHASRISINPEVDTLIANKIVPNWPILVWLC